ncbi:MAG TPA: hypothetical protein VK177_20955 [Flavobacteriales bacterium]|nr:hypothetical protein [Flavobacteriales bacterium]
MQNREISKHERLNSKKLFLAQFYTSNNLLKQFINQCQEGGKTLDFPAIATHFKQE